MQDGVIFNFYSFNVSSTPKCLRNIIFTFASGVYIRNIFFESWPNNLSITMLYLRCKYFRDTILLRVADKKIIGSSNWNTRIVMLYKIIITQQWFSTCKSLFLTINSFYLYIYAKESNCYITLEIRSHVVIVDLISRNDPYFAVKRNHYLIARGTRNRYRSIHRLLYIIFLFLKEILLVFSLFVNNRSRIICYDRISRSTSKRETMETRNKSFNLCKNFDRACTIPPSRLKFLR